VITVVRQGATSQPRKRLDAAARRETILAAAVPAFAVAGYDQTRVSDIAARIGVSEPVVFQNFGTKADLFVAVLDRVSEDAERFLATLSEDSHDVVRLLSAMLAPDLHDQMHASGGLGVLFAEAAHRAETPIREAARRANERVAQGMAAILRRGQEEGSVRRDADPIALAWLVLSQIPAREFRRTQPSGTSPLLEQALGEALLDVLRPPGRGRPGPENHP
jgi:AcrR family transcriptional regulator